MKAIAHFFTENGREKLLALLVTVAVWVGVVASREEPIAFTVKVRFETGPDRMVMTQKPQEEIFVQARGSLFAAAQARSVEKEMVIDVRHREPGRAVHFIDERDLPALQSLTVEQIVPREIAFTIAKRITKTVRVEPMLDGQPKRGYKIAQVLWEPRTIAISGPEESASQIETVFTRPVAVSGVSGTVRIAADPAPGHTGVTVTPAGTKVTVTVEVTRDIRELLLPKVPLLVDGGVATEMRPDTVSVRVKGPLEVIERLSETGLNAFVENLPARLYTVERYYFKDLPADLEIVETEPVKQITIRKKNP